MLDDKSNWLFTPPRTRRWLMLSGWSVFLAIPVVCLIIKYPVSMAFASMYATLGAAVGGVIGIYMYRRGKQDEYITQNLPYNKMASKLEEFYLGESSSNTFGEEQTDTTDGQAQNADDLGNRL